MQPSSKLVAVATIFVAVSMSDPLWARTFDPDQFMAGSDRNAMILLETLGHTASGSPVHNYGTGFFINSSGFALTSAEIFFADRDTRNAGGKIAADQLGVTILQGRIGSASESEKRFELISIDTSFDVALVRLIDPLAPTASMAICKRAPNLADHLYGVGFPVTLSMQMPDGRVTGGAVGAFLPLSFAIAKEMVGGPIVDGASGSVIGIGLTNQASQNAVVLPVQFAWSTISGIDVSEGCEEGASALPPELPSRLTDLAKGYDKIFWDVTIRTATAPLIDAQIDQMIKNRTRYEEVSSKVRTPWYVVAAVHFAEVGGNFDVHLHNGDPLSARTIHAPANRPPIWPPPDGAHLWEYSAEDALRVGDLADMDGLSVGETLVRVEKYNGLGYFYHQIASPYLWGGTSLYTGGKFAADGHFDPKEMSNQPGVATILIRMSERKIISLVP